MNAALSVASPSGSAPTAPASGQIATTLSLRLMVGLSGILLAALMSGLGNRVGAIALTDTRAALGLGADDGAWLTTAYTVGELVAMPISCWLAVTFSLRRFHICMVATYALLNLVMPEIHDLSLLVTLRAIQGLAGGMLIPVLMMAALRFLPLSIRLYGLAMYALTATFPPNLAFWVAGQWSDVWFDWRLIYWQTLPLSLAVMLMVGWGLPQDPALLGRLRQANWFGLVCACVGLTMLGTGLDRGARLDWWRSDLILWLVGGGAAVIGIYLLTEWYHPSPFIKPQLLGKRNLGLGFTAFVIMLMIMLSGSLLPAMHLERVWDYRNLQIAPVGLIVALPQPVLGSLVALLLYQKWIDARHVFVLGLALIALACFLATRLSSDWIWSQFLMVQMLEACGQPMAVVSLLFLCTSVVQPLEGPYVAGIINTLRAFGSLLGGAIVTHFLTLRERFHSDMLLDHVGHSTGNFPLVTNGLANAVREQAFILAASDSYLMLGAIALLLIPLVLCLNRVQTPS
ncbi:Major Facilitator Superfamily protein [Collimonas sp. OK307]|uniref:MFS transporter n=1 Tax=Collimonas sp. OK307 TaxID=1801620 RepID=UPI0008E80737|nr:MFS transporter [Collimonas sp. OK307]SFI32233.1 Major Facilitator Superfamily protein [Collimonas sp. OK307]